MTNHGDGLKRSANFGGDDFVKGENENKGKEGGEKKQEVIDINKLHHMKQKRITNSGLTTLTSASDESVYDGGSEQINKKITNEEEAIAAAYHIFRNSSVWLHRR
ncbi:Mechanosensitive ion channel protein [Forsythia ovata]|uniref:Mechanosensitive ion channel protein n=1 Tax=Forsythia ovata TaxID=205694 RepID=A0ABD1W764_9LAMI